MIINLLLNRLKDHLLEKMPDTNLIKVGRFQDNPLENFTYLAISGGNTRDSEYIDGITSMGDMKNIGMKVPTREFGGGQYWWRRGMVDIGYYGVAVALNELETVQEAYNFLGQAQYWIDHCRVADLKDEFGEQALLIEAYSSTFVESGGPDNQYIYRGQIMWQALTARN